MTITATCGHRIPDNDEKYSVTCKGWTRTGDRCLSYRVVCLDCQEIYRKGNWVLDNEAEEQAWVNYDDPL